MGIICIGAASCTTHSAKPASDLVAQTAVGDTRCTDAANQQLKPFLVEWDATDLALFEALASQNLVFVKYEGCSLEVLDNCMDGSVPGKYGNYQPPLFTSGTKENISIKNEDELYAELPLGANSFGGHIRNGESLDLEYFVTGVRSATRQSVSIQQINQNPGCEGATHYVAQYHLGAFRLGTTATSGNEAGISVSKVKAGGRSTHAESKLKEGGDFESCTETHQQLRCRVPIRVVLRQLSDEPFIPNQPISDAAPVNDSKQDPKYVAGQLRNAAIAKEKQGDGNGCLEDMARADQLDPVGAKNPGFLYIRAYCQMISGECEKGKAIFREFLISTDTEHRMSDEEIEKQLHSTANSKCPSSTATNLEDRITRAVRSIHLAQNQFPVNAQACLDELARNEEILVPRTKEMKTPATIILQRTADCLSAAGRCDEARAVWSRYYKMNWPELTDTEREMAEQKTFEGFHCTQ